MTTFVPTYPVFPALSDSIQMTRDLTASNNPFQTTNQQIVQNMHSFYSYDLPAKYRSLKLKDIYTFTTNVGQDVYPFNSELYTTVNMPCYCAKREIKLFNDPWSFYGVNYNWQQINNFAVGDGTRGPYSGNTTARPFIASVNNDPGPLVTRSPGVTGGSNLYFPQSRLQNILISANAGFRNTQNVTDDGLGNPIQIFDTSNGAEKEYAFNYYRKYASLDPDVPTASINYETGEITDLYFDQAIPQGVPISIAYNPKTLSIPLSIMFYQNQFTLAPVPNAGYTVELSCYRQPVQALIAAAMSGNPELSEWWEILAIGSAKKTFQRRLDEDGDRLMDKMLRERYDIIETRTYAQIGQERIQTIYTDQLTQNYGSGGFGTGFGSI